MRHSQDIHTNAGAPGAARGADGASLTELCVGSVIARSSCAPAMVSAGRWSRLSQRRCSPQPSVLRLISWRKRKDHAPRVEQGLYTAAVGGMTIVGQAKPNCIVQRSILTN
jgi:hypothetical protein